MQKITDYFDRIYKQGKQVVCHNYLNMTKALYIINKRSIFADKIHTNHNINIIYYED